MVPSIPRCLRRACAELIYFRRALTVLTLLLGPYSAPAAEDSRQLQLEVYINNAPTRFIGSFIQMPDRRIAARRAELAQVGVKVPVLGSGDELVVIDNLPDVAYRYEEPTQRIFFNLNDEQRITQTYDLRGSSDEVVPARADYGSVLNYTLFAASSKSFGSSAVTFSGANVSLDGRLFSPYGTLSQSSILGSTTTRGFDALRLDTTWTYSNPKTLLTYRAGDLISGGLVWTRPIRLGGVQIRRNFSLRPDLVTLPLPNFSGSAAVPSTLDIYVDSMKTHSQEVPSGPYQVNNIPVLSGAGTARVVLHDSAGRQIETILPFYTSPKLLKQGLLDFSLEAGLPRIFYGTASSSYVESAVSSASLRGGLHDLLTLESHAEGGADLFNAGLGTVARVGSSSLLSLAGSASRFGDAFGFQSYVAFDTQIMTINIHASSLQTFGTYNDLASVTACCFPAAYPGPTFSAFSGTSPPRLLTTTRPPKSVDNISIGFPLPFDRSTLNFGYLHQVLGDGTRSDIVNVSYARSLFGEASFFVTGFSNISDRKNTGVFFGLSMPLGSSLLAPGSVLASTGVSSTRNGTNVTFDAVKSMQPETGSYGWRVRDSEGRTPYRSAAASYRSSVAQFDGYVQQVGRITGASVQAQGAIAAVGGGVFSSNRIDDAFAVVDAGAPNVDVLYENRPAGKTNAQGQLLIPSLRSYQRNKIAIDPRDLPVDADAPMTQNVVAPADRSGVVVGFGVKTELKAAVVVFSDKSGKFILPGSQGQLEGANEPFVVGYDGRAYVKGLGANNSVVITRAEGECHVSFPFMPKKNSQVVIGPMVCQ
jgi:outer membrane usher protein